MTNSTIHEPTVIQTAVRSSPAPGGQDLTARMVTEITTRTRTWLPATGTWRETRSDMGYDSYGLPIDGKDLGDITTTADDRCTRTDYARDIGKGLVNFPSQVITTSCAATPGDRDYGRFRATHVAVRRGGDWLLAGMHLSPLGGPPPFTPEQASAQGEPR